MAHQIGRKAVGTPAYQALPVATSTMSSRVRGAPKTRSTTIFTEIGMESDSRPPEGYQNVLEQPARPRQKPATWGIYWRKPTFIISMLLLGFILSLGHHFYYGYLNGRVTGNAAKQAWPTRIGTGLAFLITSLFKAGTVASLGQYIWRAVKRQPFTMGKTLSRSPFHLSDSISSRGLG